ncbi:hypothetical protein FOZ63_014406 [Perkinsus olseni]|uniref:Uncharacterized protein n=1 Tax=Perkinsus olseni TaxID=32597 RepID=A0A7J6QGI2_PEROL|nr:hypothetical protein FOZ62_017682 [Perkinsus olseni]KAF4716361.1 hypothetical protein FOZ63_014406 [Perkinsus olseni]
MAGPNQDFPYLGRHTNPSPQQNLSTPDGTKDPGATFTARVLSSVRDSTLSTYITGLRSFGRFCRTNKVPLKQWPPTNRHVAHWLISIERYSTAKTYLNGVRFFARAALGREDEENKPNNLNDQQIKTALRAVKLHSPPPRQARALPMEGVRAILDKADSTWTQADPTSRTYRAWDAVRFATCTLLGYTAALRVPSEALTLTTGHVKITRTCAYITLDMRKNKKEKTVVARPCICDLDRASCCVHRLEFILDGPPPQCKGPKSSGGCTENTRLFPYSAASFNTRLRKELRATGWSKAESQQFSSHSLRRGSTHDLVTGGGLGEQAPLTQVLRHMGTTSRSFLGYVNQRSAETLEFRQMIEGVYRTSSSRVHPAREP